MELRYILLQVVARIVVVLIQICIHSMNPTVSHSDCHTLSFCQIRLSQLTLMTDQKPHKRNL